MIEVKPVSDSIEHLDGNECSCNPELVMENEEMIWVHNALMEKSVTGWVVEA